MPHISALYPRAPESAENRGKVASANEGRSEARDEFIIDKSAASSRFPWPRFHETSTSLKGARTSRYRASPFAGTSRISKAHRPDRQGRTRTPAHFPRRARGAVARASRLATKSSFFFRRWKWTARGYESVRGAFRARVHYCYLLGDSSRASGFASLRHEVAATLNADDTPIPYRSGGALFRDPRARGDARPVHPGSPN